MGNLIEFPWKKSPPTVVPLVRVIRHADKQGPNGPLSGKGVCRANTLGYEMAERYTNASSAVTIAHGVAERVEQTADIIDKQFKLHNISTRREIRADLSSTAIIRNPQGSELLRLMIKEIRQSANCTKDKEDKAVGRVLLQWMDKGADGFGVYDIGTIPFDMVQKIQAYYLYQEMQEAKIKWQNHQPLSPTIKITHEIQAFVLQTLTYEKGRRGKLIRDGKQIMREKGGVTPTLSGPEFCMVPGKNGEIEFRMRMTRIDKNGKKNGYQWYEIDETLVKELAGQVIPLTEDYTSSKYDGNTSLIIRSYRNMQAIGWPVVSPGKLQEVHQAA